MNVFRLEPDYNYARFYTWDPNGDKRQDLYSSGLVGIGGSRKADSWKPLNLYPDQSKQDRGNFIYLLSCNFAIDERALAICRPLLEPCCEFLPLAPYEGQVFFLLNVLECVDCLDKRATTWVPVRPDTRSGERPEGTRPISIDEYSFDRGRLPTSSLFRIPEERSVGELTVSGLVPIDEEFKSVVEREGLTGLRFEEIWSEGGPPVGREQRLRKALGF
jgi:hypothetical protein